MTPLQSRRWTKDTKLELTRDAFLTIVQYGSPINMDDASIALIKARYNTGLEPPYFTINTDDGTPDPFFFMHDAITGEVIEETVVSIHHLEPRPEPNNAELLRKQYSEVVFKARRVRESSVYEGWVRNARQSKKSYTIEGDLISIIDFLLGE